MQRKLWLSLLLAVVASAALAQGPVWTDLGTGLDPATGLANRHAQASAVAGLTSVTQVPGINVLPASISPITSGQTTPADVTVIQADPFSDSRGEFLATDQNGVVTPFTLLISADTNPPTCTEGPITVSGGLASRIMWVHDSQSPIDVIGNFHPGVFTEGTSGESGPNDRYVIIRQIQIDQPASLWFIATDSAANVANCAVSIDLPLPQVEFDTVPPTIMPMVGVDTNNHKNATVTINDPSGVAVIITSGAINGTLVPPVFTPGVLSASFIFTQTDPLLASSLSVTATDTAGNTATATITIPAAQPPDTTPPSINFSVLAGVATVTVTDADSGLQTVQAANPVNGLPGTPTFAAGDKTVSFNFTQTDPYVAATLDVAAADVAGLSASVTVVIPATSRPADTTPPEYNITLSPGKATVVLTDAESGLDVISLADLVNGSAAPPTITSGDPSAAFDFTQANAYLPSTLDVTASDVAGNAANFTVTVPARLADTTPPAIAYKGWYKSGTTYYAKFQVTDAQSGVKSIVISNLVNGVLQPPVFTPGAAVVNFTVSWVNPSKGLSFFETLTDVAGNVFAADPIEALVVKASNAPVYYGPYTVTQAESHVRIENSSPGLTRLTIIVNKRVFQVKLADGQTVDLSIARAMVPGENQISFVAYGGHNMGVASVSVN